jgi:hypothetical protein
MNAAIIIDLDTAQLVRGAFLPRNPNKMRGAAPEIVAAAHKFIAAVGDAENATPKDAVEELAKNLAFAWSRYVELFGEPPHGTEKQLAALIELCVGW